MAGRHKMKNENGETVDKPVIDACGDELEVSEQENEFAPYVSSKRIKYGGSYSQYIELQGKINRYLNAKIPHTYNGLALFLQCWPEHLKELERGDCDKQKTNFKPSDLVKQFRLYMENELYTSLPLKTDADAARLTGKAPEQEEQNKADIEQYAK